MEFRGVTFFEANGSPVEQLADDQSRAVRELTCDWDQRATLAGNLVGYPTLVKAGSVTYISRVTPHGYTGLARVDGSSFLWCTSVNRMSGQGESGPTVSGENTRYRADDGGVGLLPTLQNLTCTLLAEYRSPLYDILEDDACTGTSPSPLAGFPDEGLLLRYVERYFEPAYAGQVIPRNLFKTVEATPRPVAEPMNKVHARATVVYVHRMRPDLPVVAIQAAAGKVNATAFDNGAYPAGTLLCLPPRVRPYVSSLGQRLYDLRFAFALAYNVDGSGVARGWNGPYVTRTDGSIDYTEVSIGGTSGGQHLYRTYEFTKLFQPDQ